MAQILDLGKIRFNWAGTYNPATTYEYNDLVKYGPNLYAFTATASASGIVPTDTGHWVTVTEGVDYRGLYANNTHYYKNDIVFDGTSAWIVVNEHTSNGAATTSSNADVELIALGQPGLPSFTNHTSQLLSNNGSTALWTDETTLSMGYWGTSQGLAASTFETNAGLTDAVNVFAKTTANFAQLALVNPSNGASASADVIAYTADGNNDSGWIDLGITSNNFSAANFGITGPHDGYIFMSAPRLSEKAISKISVVGTVAKVTTTTAHGFSVGNVVKVEGVGNNVADQLATITAVTSTTFSWSVAGQNITPYTETDVSPFGATYKPKGNGNLVFATDRTGLANAIVFAAGGYDSGTSQMTIYPNNVVNISIATESTEYNTGALVVAGGVGVGKNLHVNGNIQSYGSLFVGSEADNFANSASLTSAAMVVTTSSSANSFAQLAMHNTQASSSADFIAYPDNGADGAGWIDMGITGSTFGDPAFPITGPNDGYLFMEAPAGTTGHGNLVLATGANGTQNRIVFAAGGYDSGRTQMTIVPDVKVDINIATPSTSATTGALVVHGGVGITGDVNIAGNINFGGTGTNVSTANLAVNAPLIFTGSGSLVSTSDLGMITEGKYTITNIPVAQIINKQLTSNKALLTTRKAHNFAVGDSVVIASVDSTYNGTYTITDVDTTTTFKYANTNTDLASTAIGKVNYTITTKVLTSNVATLTTSVTHALTVGTIVDITGVDSTFNGTYTVTAVTTNTFSYAKTNNNVSSAAATGTASYYTSVSTATVAAATRTRWSAFTKKASDGVWNFVSNISTIPTTVIDYAQNTYGNGVDVIYEKMRLGSITLVGSGSLYGAPYGSLTFSGDITSAAWTTTGIRHVGSGASVLTDSTSTGTVTAAYTNTFGSNVTIAASNATTYTDYANAYFGDVTAGTNVTFTNKWSILTGGAIKVGGALAVTGNTTLTGTLQANGNIAAGSNVFTVNATSGNTAISGTLTATGLATLNGGIAGGSSSDITINTNKFTVAASTGNTVVAGTLGVSGNTTLSGTLSVTGLASFPGGISVTGTERFTGRFDVQEMREDISNVTMATNVLTVDYTVANVYYSATAASANFTINLTNVPTDADKAISISVIQVQGSTGYIPTTFQIDGSSQTIKWSGGTAPTPTSTTGKIDIFNFSLLRTGGSWIVLGSSNLNY